MLGGKGRGVISHRTHWLAPRTACRVVVRSTGQQRDTKGGHPGADPQGEGYTCPMDVSEAAPDTW